MMEKKYLLVLLFIVPILLFTISSGDQNLRDRVLQVITPKTTKTTNTKKTDTKKSVP